VVVVHAFIVRWEELIVSKPPAVGLAARFSLAWGLWIHSKDAEWMGSLSPDIRAVLQFRCLTDCEEGGMVSVFSN
jgi:hypothetical protein